MYIIDGTTGNVLGRQKIGYNGKKEKTQKKKGFSNFVFF
jgi:hypothetical protein